MPSLVLFYALYPETPAKTPRFVKVDLVPCTHLPSPLPGARPSGEPQFPGPSLTLVTGDPGTAFLAVIS